MVLSGGVSSGSVTAGRWGSVVTGGVGGVPSDGTVTGSVVSGAVVSWVAVVPGRGSEPVVSSADSPGTEAAVDSDCAI